MTEDWLPFIYRDYYDIPRAIVVKCASALLFLDDPFDDALDDYAAEYRVYLLPSEAEGTLEIPSDEDRVAGRVAPSWKGLAERGRFLGTIASTELRFDETRRRYLDGAPLRRFATNGNSQSSTTS